MRYLRPMEMATYFSWRKESNRKNTKRWFICFQYKNQRSTLFIKVRQNMRGWFHMNAKSILHLFDEFPCQYIFCQNFLILIQWARFHPLKCKFIICSKHLKIIFPYDFWCYYNSIPFILCKCKSEEEINQGIWV